MARMLAGPNPNRRASQESKTALHRINLTAFMATLIMALAMLLLPAGIEAQSASTSEAQVLELKQQLLKLQQTLELQRQQVELLQRQIQSLESQPRKQPTEPSKPAVAPTPESSNTPAPTPNAPWKASDPIRIAGKQGSSSFLNLSLDGLFAAGGSTASDIEALQPGGHDPRQRGFTVQNVEAVLEGVVDPYFRGQANIIYLIDPSGESRVELEEAYLESLHLPGNLQLKAGQFQTEFGRQNPTHPHSWDFADQSLINARLFGEDGLRNPGARLSWLVPTPFYSELLLAVQNSHGETASSFRAETDDGLIYGRPTQVGSVQNLGDLLFTPRYVTSFNLTDSQTLLAGVSGAFGPNSAGGNSRILGADLFWKWKPTTHHKGFPFVTWQTEAMLRRYSMSEFEGDLVNPALPGEALKDWGWYSQASWGFRPGWIAGLRGDYVAAEASEYEEIIGRDLGRATRWRVSPNLTFLPSEFSKIRLQYNYDDRAGFGIDHSVWLQWEFLLGSHAAHKY